MCNILQADFERLVISIFINRYKKEKDNVRPNLKEELKYEKPNYIKLAEPYKAEPDTADKPIKITMAKPKEEAKESVVKQLKEEKDKAKSARKSKTASKKKEEMVV